MQGDAGGRARSRTFPALSVAAFLLAGTAVRDACACIVTDQDGREWDLTAIGGMTEGRGTGPTSCTTWPDCDWLYFFDVCNAPTSIGPIPGRPTALQCLSTYNTVAIRIEDEGNSASPLCTDLGADGAATQYIPIDRGLQVKFSRLSFSLTVDLLCGARGPSKAESGLNAGPDYADDEFVSGVAKLTWTTNAVCAASHGWLIVHAPYNKASGRYIHCPHIHI